MKSFLIRFRISNFTLFLAFFFFVSDQNIEEELRKKSKGGSWTRVKIRVILECASCVQNGVNRNGLNVNKGINRYITQKNRHTTPKRLELRKFCPNCHKHTIHGEITK